MDRAFETGRDQLRKSNGEREGREGRERKAESQLSRNLRAYLAAGTRWLGAEEGAVAVALASGDGTVAEVAVTLELGSASDASQHQQLLLFPLLWVWGGPGALGSQ